MNLVCRASQSAAEKTQISEIHSSPPLSTLLDDHSPLIPNLHQ